MKAFANLNPRRKEELAGLLVLTLGCMVFFALATHSAADDSRLGQSLDFSIFEVAPDNWIGLVGAGLSYLLLYLLGLLAFFIPVYALLIGVRYLFRWHLPVFRKKVFYSLMICISLALILSVKYVQGQGKIDFITTPGGAATVTLTGVFLRLFGQAGSLILFVTAIIFLFFLLIDWRPRWWEKNIATVPGKIKAWMLGLFGIGTGGRTKKTSRTQVKTGKGFRLKALARPFIRFFGIFKGWFHRVEVDQEIEAETPQRGISAEKSIRDLFENLETDEESEASIAESTEEGQEREKFVLRLTRKPEDGYKTPEIAFLDENPQPGQAVSNSELNQVAEQLRETLSTFHIEIADEKIEKYPGPIITRYEFKPAPGIKVNQVLNLSDDLALALRAKRIRIIAPVPGKAAIGVEIPNRFPQTVYLRDVLADKEFTSKKHILPMALGLSTAGDPFVTDLASMPHLLIAGATGSGKSVCMNVIITSLIYCHHPRNMRFLFIDPKMLELSVYSGIPHLERPVITRPKQAERVLNDTVVEMENRYRTLASKGARNIIQYNLKVPPAERLPYIVIMVDELADLMMSSQSSRIEILLTRLAQMARAVGIHLILATQRPSVDVITGLIKANFSARIAFQVATKIDSRTILDGNGAEKLLGKGDMLFLAPGQAEPVRIHGAFISSDETTRLVEFLNEQQVEIKKIESMTEEEVKKRALVSDADPLFKEAAEVVIRHKQGSVSLLQRRLGIGYQRAARLIDLLETKGIVGPYDGSKAREVLADQTFLEKFKTGG
jgi:S-DNA-T family DNA segregation ATPase FtsK/SpoIIIE